MSVEQLSLLPHGCVMAHTVQQRVLHDTKSLTATGRGITARQGGKCSAQQRSHRSQAIVHKSSINISMIYLRLAYGGKTGHILISCDSTILASVFLTRRAVRREEGLWAQHSDISFSMARKHCVEMETRDKLF